MLIIRLRSILLIAPTFLLCLGILNAQSSEVSTEENISLSDTERSEMEFEKTDYRALIGSQYISRFSELSDKLQDVEDELRTNQVQINRTKQKLSKAENKEDKTRYREQSTKLRTTEERLKEEIKILKKGLRLLQTNKAKSDPIKLNTLNQVNELENEIILLQGKYESRKNASFLSKMIVEDRNTYVNPLPVECKFAYNGQDANSKKIRKEAEKEFLFGYTHPKLKSYFKDKHFLECEAQMVQLNKKNYLWLHFTISSKDAIKNYGFIEKRSPLKIELINGDILYASNAQNSTGKLEPYTGNTKYVVILPLDKSKMKQLERSEIDKIGVMWSSGYEQYEILHVDLVMNQINCIKNN